MSFLESYKNTEEDYNKYLADKGFNSIYNFIRFNYNVKNYIYAVMFWRFLEVHADET